MNRAFTPKRIIVIGGGITGLSCAYYLREKGKALGLPIEITLVEAEARLGGKIRTDRLDDFIVEAGPDSFITQKPHGLELCQKLGVADRLIRTADIPRKVFLLRRGKLRPLPEGMLLMLPGRFLPFLASSILSAPGKLRMGLDLFIPPRRDDADETLGSFVRRRLGREALEILAEPLMAGIYVSDPEEMSMAATFPQFLEMERKHGGLIRAMLARKKVSSASAPSPSPWTLFVSLREGLSELIGRLSQRLTEVQILPGVRIEKIGKTDRGLTLFCRDHPPLPADAVVVTTPAPTAARLLAEEDPDLARKLSEIRYASTATVSLAFRRKEVLHPLDGFGFVVPRNEGKRILACTFSSSKFPDRAPKDAVLIRGFLGGAKDEGVLEMDDADLVRLVVEELRPLLGIAASPLFAKLFRWKGANPQYTVGHLDRVSGIESAAARHSGLHLAGAAYRGVGIPDCIRQGIQTADNVLDAIEKKD
jgi:oxygen-dependent protoporphyrinogen oxidase